MPVGLLVELGLLLLLGFLLELVFLHDVGYLLRPGEPGVRVVDWKLNHLILLIKLFFSSTSDCHAYIFLIFSNMLVSYLSL